MLLNNHLNNFFSTIASTSAFETIRKQNKTDVPRLINQLQSAKFSDLGTPVIDYVELTLYEDLINQPTKQGIALQEYQHGINNKSLHLNNVEVSTSSTTNIVRTSINGIDGTFKEFYSGGDTIITLTGSLVGTIPFQNDIQNLNNFKKIHLANERFDIKSDFINKTLDVFAVVMTDFNLILSKEYSNVVDYTITLESDIDLEIIY